MFIYDVYFVRREQLVIITYISYYEKAFARSTSLNEHVVKSHTRNFPYRCRVCGAGFMTPDLLKKHYEKNH